MRDVMTPTGQLHQLGQSLWLDNITRDMLDDGTLQRYINECSITGLTSNPSIFDAAMAEGHAYDADIRRMAKEGTKTEALFLSLALDDLRRAADMFRPVFDNTHHLDGWVSMEVSPLLASDTQGSIQAALDIHAQAARPNLFVKIPGTPEGVPAIEASIFAGIPINVTLLFSPKQYVAVAEAYMRGIERRIAADRDPLVGSVASLFVSRWDVAVKDTVSETLRNTLGLAISGQVYRAYRGLLASPRWRALSAAGAMPQRLLWASTGTKDPQASDTLYVEALAAPDTIDTMPEKTLLAFADHGVIRGVMPEDGGSADATLARFAREGVDVAALAVRLQKEGAAAFVKSWNELLGRIADKSATLTHAGAH